MTGTDESNMQRLQRLETEFLDICRGPNTTTAFRRLSEVADEMATVHDKEAAELRHLADVARERATSQSN